MQVNQSRIDDITLKEDLIPESTDIPFGGDFGVCLTQYLNYHDQ